MKILLDQCWRDGFPDYHRAPASYRIAVRAWMTLEPVTGLYFVRQPSIGLLRNYLGVMGPVQLMRKVASRFAERRRNQKFLSLGIGTVLESGTGAAHRPGSLVSFIAPSHPRCVERIVLPPELIHAIETAGADLPASAIAYVDGASKAISPEPWRSLAGWSEHSAIALDPELCGRLTHLAREVLSRAPWDTARLLALDTSDRPAEIQVGRPSVAKRGQKRAVLFGYGNYAKTAIIPNLEPHVRIDCVHEIDPLQISSRPGVRRWDTSPAVRTEEGYEVFLIAGFHHTHAPIAIEALRRGAYAVIEKPSAVDREQLAMLVAAAQERPGRTFVCYQKRYSPFNELARADLRLSPGAPVSYHCIVYEEPLPALHWYRWPNSRSRLVSNGCHWIDHFLWLNGYRDVERNELFVASDGTINCSVALVNGAFFTMVLTDRGSQRIGVQEHVELRTTDATIRITNSSDYVSENRNGVIRRHRMDRTAVYGRMYRSIGQRIARDEPGDSPRSLQLTGEVVLALDDRLQAMFHTPPIGTRRNQGRPARRR